MKKIFLLVLVFPTVLHAGITFEDVAFPELAISARALAMGNAYICKVDNYEAAFYNPAGLGSYRGKSRFNFFNTTLEANKDLWSARGSDSFINYWNGGDLESLRETFLNYRGHQTFKRVQAAPNVIFRYFSAGFLYSKKTRAAVGSNAAAQFEYAQRRDLGPYGALNLSLFGGIIKFGYMGILLNRKEIIGESSRTVAIDENNLNIPSSSAFISTGGFRLTLPWDSLPTFAIVSHNMASTTFTGTNKPADIKNNIVFGASITPKLGDKTKMHIEFNYKDLTGLYTEVNVKKRLAFGLELDFARKIFMRLGWGDGFGSGGIGVRGRNFQFNLSTYGVDTRTDTSSLRGSQDRRFALEFSWGLEGF